MPATNYVRIAETVQVYLLSDLNVDEAAIWCGGDATRATSGSTGSTPATLAVPTLQGVLTATEGDYVYRKPNGRFDVRKPKPFLRDYAPATP